MYDDGKEIVAYPGPIANYLRDHVFKPVDPAYVRLSHKGVILAWGGRLDHYGIPLPRKGLPAAEIICFTEGLLPMTGDGVVIECAQFGEGAVADIHLFKEEDTVWLLLIDARERARRQRNIQQKINEAMLVRDRRIRARRHRPQRSPGGWKAANMRKISRSSPFRKRRRE